MSKRYRKLTTAAATVALMMTPIAIAETTEQLDQTEQRASLNPEKMQDTNSKIQVESSTKIIRDASTQDRQAMSMAAGRILVHSVRARDAIGRQSSKEALDHVEDALLLSRIVEQNAPEFKVTTTINSGELNYSNEEDVKNMTVPVFTELEQFSIIAPLQASQKQGQDSTSKAAALRVADTDIAATSILLDVRHAARNLETAKQALSNENFEAADRALLALQQGVTTQFIAADLPLVQARQNLMLAKTYAEDGNTARAKELLNAVGRSLSQYEKTATGTRATEVAALRKDIESTSKNMSGDSSTFASKISSWWDNLTQWAVS